MRSPGRSPAFHLRAEEIPRPAQILHLALAVDLVRGLTGAEAAAAMVRQRAGSYFESDSGLLPAQAVQLARMGLNQRPN